MDVVLVGGGGHCRSVVDAILESGKHNIVGILDSDATAQNVLGYPILGDDQLAESFVKAGVSFLVTIGKTGLSGPRDRAISRLKELGASFATVISPRAHISRFAKIGEGSVVLHGVVVNAAATVGKHCMLNSGSIVEHDVELGEGCHLSPGAVVNGGAKLAAGTFLGSSSIVGHSVLCNKQIVLGAGSFLKDEVTVSGLYVGSPAKIKKEYYE